MFGPTAVAGTCVGKIIALIDKCFVSFAVDCSNTIAIAVRSAIVNRFAGPIVARVRSAILAEIDRGDQLANSEGSTRTMAYFAN